MLRFFKVFIVFIVALLCGHQVLTTPMLESFRLSNARADDNDVYGYAEYLNDKRNNPGLRLTENICDASAGLIGDELPGEQAVEAAARELFEETGYQAGRIEFLTRGPVSPGLTDEIADLFYADQLQKVHQGGGDDTEDITVHVIPLVDLEPWLKEQEKRNCLVDPKVFMALHFVAVRGHLSR